MASDSFVDDIVASTIKVNNTSEFDGILDLSAQTTPQITLDTGEFLLYNKSTNILSLTGGSIEASTLKTATGTVGISASSAPSSGDTLVATGATTATWQAPVTNTTFLADDGSDSTPSYSFTNSTNTGLYLPVSGRMSITASGREVVSISNTGLNMISSDDIFMGLGSIILSDSYTINGDSGLGNNGSVTMDVDTFKQSFTTGNLTKDTSNAILAGSCIIGISYKWVGTVPTGVSTFSLGTTGDTTKWFNAQSVGTNNTGRIGGNFEYFSANTTVRLTFNTNTTSGTSGPDGFYFTVHYMKINVPT